MKRTLSFSDTQKRQKSHFFDELLNNINYLVSSNIVATFACNSLIQGTLQYIIQYMEEIWKDIEGYERLYQISSLGRVKSTQYYNGTYERIMKPIIHKKGYLVVSLCKCKKKKIYLVHRLVAQAFIPNPDNLPCINHKDENPSNNNVDNLEWCSYQYNNTYGLRIERAAEKRVNGKYSKTVYQYTIDGKFIKEWPSTHEVQRLLGYFRTAIGACCRGKTKTAYGYKWSYTRQ